VFLLAGWSGFFVMSLELLGGRMLAPAFGSSIYVWGGVITIFMLALSLGYLAGGRLSLHRPSLRRLALLVLAAALTAAPVIPLGAWFTDVVADQVWDPRYGTLVAGTALFFVPTLVCGTVSPYAVRLLVSENRTSGRAAGLLYFVSTFGSAAGTILTSFYLVLYFELNQILGSLIAGSAAFAALAVAAGSRRDAAAD
jgi:hypothetical protein